MGSTTNATRGLNYTHYLGRFNVGEKVEQGKIDEVWIFGFPWGWIWESCMAGAKAIWINGPQVDYPCSRPFPIMGFNYERDVGCMLENLGHRAECVLNYVYDGDGWWWKDLDPNATHLWRLFTRIDKTHPGEAGCGTVHFAPNEVAFSIYFARGAPHWVQNLFSRLFSAPH